MPRKFFWGVTLCGLVGLYQTHILTMQIKACHLNTQNMNASQFKIFNRSVHKY
jgi:hypothetical protein